MDSTDGTAGAGKRTTTACDRCKEKKRKCIVTNEGKGCDVSLGLGPDPGGLPILDRSADAGDGLPGGVCLVRRDA
jgi:hypothetical protein